MRLCKKCNKEKELTELVKDLHGKDGRRSVCKQCAYKIRREKYMSPEKVKLYNSQYWRTSAVTKKSVYTLVRTPIGPYDYSVLFEKQKGLCAICGEPPKHKRLGVDHCHKTGKVRGLLCSPCNLMLGNARDSIKNLEAGICYLQQENHD